MTIAGSIASFTDYISNERRYSPHTVAAYSTDLAEFSAFLSRCDIDDVQEVSTMEIREWQMELMSEGVKPRSVARKLASLRSWYKYLRRMKYVRGNPFANVSPPKLDKPLPIFFRESESEKIYDLPTPPDDDFAGNRDLLILQVFYETGMRRSELLTLKVSSFDFSARTVRVLGKRDKERIIPIEAELIKKVRHYLSLRERVEGLSTDRFFITPKGEAMSIYQINKVVKGYMSQLSNANRISPHIFRHSFATHMLNEGADINAVKELLGHADLSATQIYTHVTREYLKETYRHAHPRASGR